MTVLTASPISLPVNLMLSGAVWSTSTGAPVTVSYDFLQEVPSALSTVIAGDPAENIGWSPLSTYQQAQTTSAMAAISAVANINFVASADESTANILIGSDNQTTSGAYTSYVSYSFLESGGFLMHQDHIEISNNQVVSGTMFPGFMLHELANATGLEDFVVDTSIPDALNDLRYSVQSYEQFSKDHDIAGQWGGDQPVTPQILDVLAWQYLYGANENGYTPSVSGATESHTGNNHIYQFSTTTPPMTVWIGANVSGINIFDFGYATFTSTIDLTPGTLSGTGAAPNVGISYGTIIQVGIASVSAATLYADATTGHHNLLIGSENDDTFVAGDSYDVFVSGDYDHGDIVQFHDPYADYKIVAGANGGTLVIDQAAHPKDGTVALSGGFSEMQFGDGTNIFSFPSGSEKASEYAMVETAATIGADLDIYQATTALGAYIHEIILADSGVPDIQISAAQSVEDAQVLPLITSPYSLSIEMPATSADAQGPGNGVATTIVLFGTASQYTISIGANGSITLTDGGQMDHLSNVRAGLGISDSEISGFSA